MSLRLVVGPARSGKIGVLADRFLTAVSAGSEPFLIVPNVPEADAVERELAGRAGVLLGGTVTTFDGLATRVLDRTGGAPPAPAEPVRALLLRRLTGGRRLDALGESARFAGFAAALGRFADECGQAGVEPDALAAALDDPESAGAQARDVAGLVAAWRASLAAEGLADRTARLAEAARRAGDRLDAWGGEPLLVYGFEELAAAQLDLLEAVAARAEVTVALPFEPARPAFEALKVPFERLAARADEIDELPPGRYVDSASLRALERGLFSDRAPVAPAEPDGAVRLLETAGAQGEAEAVAAEAAALLRSGYHPDAVLVVVPSPEAMRGPLERAFAALGVPASVDARIPLGRTSFGHALLGLLRFAWLDGDRDALFAWLRSPASALDRARVDAWEGRIRGRGRRDGAGAYALLQEIAGRTIEGVETLRAADDPLTALRGLLERAAPAAFGLGARVRGEGPAALQVRAWRAADRALASLAALSEPATTAELVRVLEGVQVRVGDDRPSGRVRVVGLRRSRTHRADAVIVVGLEEGRLPGRGRPEAFLSDDLRRALAARGLRLERRDGAARERYLFYTAVTRARRQLVLVRRATGDDGTPREPSPFWEDVLRALGDGAPPPLRRGLAELTHPLETAPSQRERLRALAAVAADDPLLAARLAAANGDGWARKVDRARKALIRRTKLADPDLLAELAARARFPVSELESFVDCSQKWFVMRVLDPRDIDGVVDAKTKGKVAHSALQRFFTRLPATIGKDVLEAEDLPRAEPLLREVIAESLARERLPQDSLEMLELGRALERDLIMFLRSELALEHRLVPRRLEVSFGAAGPNSTGPGLGGLVLGDFTVSGRIDRIDVDPHAARGLVQDYKYSTRAEGASDIPRERRLQLPLYILALRDLLGLEPVGGVYRALGAGGVARGLIRAEAREDGAEGFRRADYLDEDAFWGVIEAAADDARGAVRRIRRGDIRHDPRQGTCPAWCDVHPICRVARP